MKCYICKNEAKEIKPLGDYVHLKCRLCGEYKVDAKALLNDDIHRMNPDRILGRLAQKFQKTREVPVILNEDI